MKKSYQYKLAIKLKTVVCSIGLFLVVNIGYTQTKSVEKAQAHFNMKEYAEALSILEKVVKKDENNYLATKLLANIYFKLRAFDKASVYFNELVKMQEVKADDFLAFGQVLLANARAEEAIHNFKEYLKRGGTPSVAEMLIEAAEEGLLRENLKSNYKVENIR